MPTDMAWTLELKPSPLARMGLGFNFQVAGSSQLGLCLLSRTNLGLKLTLLYKPSIRIGLVKVRTPNL